MTAVTDPRTPPYDAAAPRPPISLPPARTAAPADSGTARMLAIGVVVLSGLYTALAVLAEVPFDLAALAVADDRQPGDVTAFLGAGLVLGSLVLLLPLWIVTSLWLGAERDRLGGRSFTHGTAGTFASWVVPLVNLVWPFRVVREVHERAVEPQRRVSLGWWWTLWLSALLLGRISDRAYTQQDYGDPVAAILASSALYVVALVLALSLWVRIVLSTSRVRT